MILTFFLLFNVFTMILLKQFEEFYRNPLNPLRFYEKYVSKFKFSWAHFYKSDKEKKNIHFNRLNEFLRFLGPPLGNNKNIYITKLIKFS